MIWRGDMSGRATSNVIIDLKTVVEADGRCLTVRGRGMSCRVRVTLVSIRRRLEWLRGEGQNREA